MATAAERGSMTLRRAYQIGAVVWAIVGLSIALSAEGHVNADVQAVVATLSVALPLTAVMAASALRRERDRVAGIFLLLSSATPTYFAWPLNLPALVVGGWLVIRGRVSLRRGPGPSGLESSGPAS